MKTTAKIILCTLLLAFSMQSASIAGTTYTLKPVDEIGKNLFGMGVEKAKENPEMVEEGAKKLMGDNENDEPEPKENKEEKENDE